MTRYIRAMRDVRIETERLVISLGWVGPVKRDTSSVSQLQLPATRARRGSRCTADH